MAAEKITVLHVDTGHGWRGGQRQAAYLFEALAADGWNTGLVCQPGSPFHRYAAEHGLPVHPVRMRGEWDFFAGMRIAALARRLRADILHLHTAHAVTLGLWARLFNPRVRLITVRRVDFAVGKTRFSRYKYASDRIDMNVCISGAIRRVMLDCGIPERKLTVIRSGADLNRFEHCIPADGYRASLGVPEGHILVGTLAAMVGHKDYPNLLRAAARVVAETDNVTFCAFGDGPGMGRVRELHRELKLGARFLLPGFRDDVGEFLKSLDVFVLASKMEGLGTSVIDAQAAGVPVVATAAGGIPEMLENGVNGILVPPRNPEALAEGIMKLVREPGLGKKFAAAATGTVRQFDIKKTVRGNIALYRELTDNKKRLGRSA